MIGQFKFQVHQSCARQCLPTVSLNICVKFQPDLSSLSAGEISKQPAFSDITVCVLWYTVVELPLTDPSYSTIINTSSAWILWWFLFQLCVYPLLKGHYNENGSEKEKQHILLINNYKITRCAEVITEDGRLHSQLRVVMSN